MRGADIQQVLPAPIQHVLFVQVAFQFQGDH